jgi:hypothetical protein
MMKRERTVQYLNTKQVAAILNVSPRQVLYFCNLQENPLPHRRPSNRIYRFVESEVVAWFDGFVIGKPEEDYSREAWDLNVEDGNRMRMLQSEREKIRS